MQRLRTIHESHSVIAYHRQGTSRYTLVVFGGAGLVGKQIDNPRFVYLDDFDLSAVIVAPRRRSWYPQAEMSTCVQAIRNAVGDATVVTYGASMGGYGAIKYAAALNARHVVAVAPQYSIDPNVIQSRSDPFVRYFQPVLNAGMDIAAGDALCTVDIVFDPDHENDREHAARIARRLPCRLTVARFAGHALEVLFRGRTDVADLLSSLMADDLAAVRRQIRQNKRRSNAFYVNLFRVLCDRKPRYARWALKMAATLPALGTDDRVGRAEALVGLGRAPEAVDALSKAHSQAIREPTRWGLATALSRINQGLGRKEEALRWGRAAVRHAPEDDDTRSRLAAALIRSGDLEEATQIAAALAADRDLPAAHFHLCQIRGLQGQTEAAIAAGMRAVCSIPSAHAWRAHLCGLLAKAGRADEAEAMCAGAVRAFGDAASWFHWSRMLQNRDRMQEALAAARRAIVLHPSGEGYRHHLAAMLADLGQAAEALAVCQDAARIGVGGSAALTQQATIHEQLAEIPEALAAAREAVARRPDGAGLWITLIDLFLRCNDLPSATVTAKAAAAWSDEPPATLLAAQARLCMRLGDVEGAIEAAGKAAALHPESAVHHGHLANYLRRGDRLQDAEAAARRAIGLRSDLAWLHRALSSALDAQGRIDEALDACRSAMACAPEEPGNKALLMRLTQKQRRSIATGASKDA